MDVLIVDDEPMVRRAVGRTLRSVGNVVVREAASVSEARATIAGTGALALLLVDLRLLAASDDRSGLQVLRELKASRRDVLAVVLTGYNDAQTAFDAAQAGADVFVTKAEICVERFRELVEMARARQAAALANDGPNWANGAIASVVLAPAAPPTPHITARLASLARKWKLTNLEEAVVTAFVAGRSRAQVAADLGISHNTIRALIHDVLAKVRDHRTMDQLVQALMREMVERPRR